MRYFASALLLLIFSTSAVPQQHAPLAKTAPLPQKISSKILAAKIAFFEDRTGVPEVGKVALDELKKWGRFQILADKTQADLILVLSASPAYRTTITSLVARCCRQCWTQRSKA